MRASAVIKPMVATAVVAVLAAAWCLGGGCRRNDAASAKAWEEPVPSVTAALAHEQAVPVQLKTFGAVEAFASVDVKPQVTAQLSEAHVRPGQEVAKGDLLFTLDNRAQSAALKMAEGNLARDIAAMHDAESDLRRAEQLHRKNAATEREVEQARWRLEGLKATVQGDQAAVENARVQLSYTTIRAPQAGRVGDILVDPGNVVQANIPNSEPLLRINQIEPILVSFSVPQQELGTVRRRMARTGGLPVRAVIPGETEPAEGAVTFINNAVDPTTGMVQLKAEFPNRDRRLWPGLYVDLVLTLRTLPRATVVPSQAIQSSQQGPFVFIIESNLTARMQPVRTGVTFNGFTVIASGVQPGERVVTDGHLRLTPGVKVRLADEPTTQPATAP